MVPLVRQVRLRLGVEALGRVELHFKRIALGVGEAGIDAPVGAVSRGEVIFHFHARDSLPTQCVLCRQHLDHETLGRQLKRIAQRIAHALRGLFGSHAGAHMAPDLVLDRGDRFLERGLLHLLDPTLLGVVAHVAPEPRAQAFGQRVEHRGQRRLLACGGVEHTGCRRWVCSAGSLLGAGRGRGAWQRRHGLFLPVVDLLASWRRCHALEGLQCRRLQDALLGPRRTAKRQRMGALVQIVEALLEREGLRRVELDLPQRTLRAAQRDIDGLEDWRVLGELIGQLDPCMALIVQCGQRGAQTGGEVLRFQHHAVAQRVVDARRRFFQRLLFQCHPLLELFLQRAVGLQLMLRAGQLPTMAGGNALQHVGDLRLHLASAPEQGLCLSRNVLRLHGAQPLGRRLRAGDPAGLL
ncbi:hypothetical protein XAUB_02490 [Xanthomonas citri pv. aurantifolii str. ICPB 11122]|nr:hypothetical protein XAUB_02490 [Xanthomonas citri pv. aurantifolii str. ICPB 11122]